MSLYLPRGRRRRTRDQRGEYGTGPKEGLSKVGCAGESRLEITDPLGSRTTDTHRAEGYRVIDRLSSQVDGVNERSSESQGTDHQSRYITTSIK